MISLRILPSPFDFLRGARLLLVDADKGGDLLAGIQADPKNIPVARQALIELLFKDPM